VKIDDFYQANSELLAKNYPGINSAIWRREYLHFLSRGDRSLFQSLAYLGIPFPYMQSRAYFYKSYFLISSDCFIPRFETELMVDMAIDHIAKLHQRSVRIADVCCGIGPIILSVMQNSDSVIWGIGIDMDPAPLYYADLNYYNLTYRINPSSSFRTRQSDRLQIEESEFDLILSNPPYLRADDCVDKSASFSPRHSLYLDNYLEWFDQFFEEIYAKLVPQGIFIMEGDERYLNDLKKIAEKRLSALQIIADYTGRERFITGRKLWIN
jgi:release factor glutamine methyltransferase